MISSLYIVIDELENRNKYIKSIKTIFFMIK